MARPSTILQNAIYYTFLVVCVFSFFLSCCGFLIYRLLLKPMAFGLILLAFSPLMLFNKFHTLAAKKNEKNNMFVGETKS